MRGFILLVLVVFGAAAGGYVFAKHEDGEPVEPVRLMREAAAFVQNVAGGGASSDDAENGAEGAAEAEDEEASSDEAASDTDAASGEAGSGADADAVEGAGDAAASDEADVSGDAASGDSFEGLASWYGPGLEGNQTASGEIFDPAQLTAAHRTLPFDTRVRVTRLDTGDSVVVRINDRGPHTPGRVIDLSQAAAEQLGLVEAGESEVRVEVLASG